MGLKIPDNPVNPVKRKQETEPPGALGEAALPFRSLANLARDGFLISAHPEDSPYLLRRDRDFAEINIDGVRNVAEDSGGDEREGSGRGTEAGVLETGRKEQKHLIIGLVPC